MVDERSTENLLLRRVQAADTEDLIRFNADAGAMATLGGVRGADETRAVHLVLLEHWERYGFGVWMARERQTGRFAGRGGLRHVSLEGNDEVEVLYGFLPEFWGRGLATELARESVRLAFTALHLPDVVCFTLATNHASQRVMEKVGFRFERHGERGGRPHVFYRLTAAAGASA